MPQAIPILYTGENIAVPDWKNFNKDANARRAQVAQRRQQQRQFDALQNERQKNQFLDSIDVDALNSTNEGLLNKKYEVTKGLEDYMTQVLTESRGDISDQDVLQAKLLTNRANQEIAKMNNWQKNQQLDSRAALKNISLYDQDKLKSEIYNWKGDTPYNSSRLESALRDMPIDEVIQGMRADIKDPNTFTTISEIGGNQVTNKETASSVYFSFGDQGELIPNDDAQLRYIKTASVTGDDAFLKQRSIDKNFSELDDVEKQSYANQAVKAGGKAEDGKFLWLRDQGGMFPVKEDVKTAPIKEKATEKSKLKELDLRKETRGSFADNPVQLTGTVTFINKEGEETTFNAGRNAVQLTEINYEVNPKTGNEEWMVSGILKRNPTEDEVLSGDVFARSVNEPIKIPYNNVKENIGRKYNVQLPVDAIATEIDLGF